METIDRATYEFDILPSPEGGRSSAAAPPGQGIPLTASDAPDGNCLG